MKCRCCPSASEVTARARLDTPACPPSERSQWLYRCARCTEQLRRLWPTASIQPWPPPALVP